MRKVDLSIIILSYNTKVVLKDCLKSITQHPTPNTEIIVVDNASTDGSPQMVEEKFANVKLIINKKNLGFAKGNNQALRLAQGKLVLFLNSDTIVQPEVMKVLVKYLNKNSQVAAVSPLLLNEDGSIQKDPCYLKFPSPLFSLFYYSRFLRVLAKYLFPRLIYSTQNFGSANEIDQLPGAALMIKKDIFEKIGGFDEDFSHFFEDVDLSYRLKKSGYRLVLVPQAKIVHLGRKSLESKVKKEGIESFYYLNFKALLQFCQKNYPLWKLQSIKAIIFLNLLLKFRFTLIKKLFLS